MSRSSAAPARATISRRTISAAFRFYSVHRQTLLGQANLLLAGTGYSLLVLHRPWLGGAALVLAHLWSWSQTAHRQRDRDRFLETLRMEATRDSEDHPDDD